MPATCDLLDPPDLAALLPGAKAHLRVTHALEDALIARLVAGAAADVTAGCGVGVGVSRYLATFDSFPGGTAGPRAPWYGLPLLPLPVRPLVAVVAVRYRDAGGAVVTLPAADYRVGPRSGRLAPVMYWPLAGPRPDPVEVEFTAGRAVAELPPQALDALLLILGDRYAHRGDGDADRRAVPAAAERLLWQLHSGEVV